MFFELRALSVSWASRKFYLEKEARVVWESDVSSEGRTMLFYSSRPSRAAQGSWHSPSWCTVTSVPQLLACRLCHLSERTKSKVWMILPLFTPGSYFLSSPLSTAAPLSSTGWFPHLRLWKLDSPGMGESLLNVCPSQRKALDNLCSFLFERR